jgi:hypothetical protein
MPNRRKTRSQTTIHTQVIHYVNHLRGCPLAPRDSHPATCLKMNFAEWTQPIWRKALGNNHWSQQHHANAVIHPVTEKEMEYLALMKDPCLQPFWTRGSGNKCRRLFQGIRDIPGTNTCFLIDLKNIPNDRNITYGKMVCD